MKNNLLLAWLTSAVLMLGAFSMPVRAAVTEAWVQRYNNVLSNQTVFAVEAVFDAAGDVIVIGNFRDSGSIAIIKFSGADGTVSWERRYRTAGGLKFDRVKDVGVDGSNNVIVLGRSYQGEGGPSDYFTVKFAAGDAALLWESRHSGTIDNRDFGHALAVDHAGNAVVTVPSVTSEGYVDACTIKYAAADGALLWERYYNGPMNSVDSPEAITVDASGNVVVTGRATGGPQAWNIDYFTAKYASDDGTLLWEKSYNGPEDREDYPAALAVDGTGNVVVTGSSYNGEPDYDSDCYTAKYAAADGALLWERRRNGEGRAVAVDASNNVFVTGSPGTIKYRADGTGIWTNTGVFGTGLLMDSNGNVVVVSSSPGNGGGTDAITAKFAAANGALLWEQRYGGPSVGSANTPWAVAVNGSGDVLVTGDSWFVSPGGHIYFFIAKYAADDGAVRWIKSRQGSGAFPSYAQAVAVDASGNVVVTGTAYNAGPNYDSDYYTAKYAAHGTLLWAKRFDGPVKRDDFPRAVAVDASGNVIVAGGTTAAGATDFYTAKYGATDGALLWEKRYTGPGYEHDLAEAVAVDNSGNVVVTGHSSNGTNAEIYTAKYAAADGALLWERRYAGLGIGANYDSYGHAVAVDGAGNVVVTGDSENGSNTDYYTAKYAATDGALLWEKRYNSPDGDDDEAKALAVDGSGNVVVTGWSATIKYLADGTGAWTNTGLAGKAVSVDGSGNVLVAGSSSNTNGNSDFYTAKYAAADGTLLWERWFNGPANGDDFAAAVAMDAGGHVVVTGGSWNGTNTDYYTAKYADTNGALLWERRYNGPANGEDFTIGSRSLALGPNGLVAITGRSSNSDGHFDFATVVYRESLSIDLISAGVHIQFHGTPGLSYQIERAPAITGPWSTNATLTAPANGQVEFVDTNAPPGSAFYRTQTL